MRWLCLVCLLCGCGRLDSFLYAPVKTDDYRLPDTLPHEENTVQSSDGVTVHWVFVPGAPGGDTLIYCHGQATDIASAWPRIEYLAPLGYNLVVWDYRGFGRSTGAPSERGIMDDEEALFGAVVAHAGVDAARLVYYGRSFGGAPCIDLATKHAPAALIEESTFTSVAALVADATPVDLPRGTVADAKWDSLSKIATLGAVPFMALHGAADDYVQPKYAAELARAHPGVTQLVLVPGANHGNVPDKMGLDTYRVTIDQFVHGYDSH